MGKATEQVRQTLGLFLGELQFIYVHIQQFLLLSAPSYMWLATITRNKPTQEKVQWINKKPTLLTV